MSLRDAAVFLVESSAAKVVFARICPMKSYKSARDLPQKREYLVVQVKFGKIISIERIE